MHTIVWPEQHTARVKALLQVHLCSLCDAGPARNILHHRRSLKPLVAQAIEKSERITCFLGQPDINSSPDDARAQPASDLAFGNFWVMITCLGTRFPGNSERSGRSVAQDVLVHMFELLKYGVAAVSRRQQAHRLG